jgi:acetyltransferase-like isoleucine patch superfamily enzyme
MNKKTYVLGKKSVIDKGVKLGYIPAKNAKLAKLQIGENARIRQGAILYAGTKIGKNLETGHNVIIREKNKIGNNFSIWSNSIIDYGCRIGNNVKIHSNIYIAQFTVIEDNAFLAPGVTIANDPHPGCDFSKKCMKGPTIKKGAQIGCNVTIVPMVTIGEKCLIGSGSVVTKDIPAGSVAYGNPARVHKKIGDLKCYFTFTDKPYK